MCVKCSCHSIHLCSHYASLHPPKSIEGVVFGMCSHFSLITKRREVFERSQKLVEWEVHVFIRLGQTWCLTMQYAVDRIMDNTMLLTKYFSTFPCTCKTDPKNNHDVILTALQDPVTRIYLELLSHALDAYCKEWSRWKSFPPSSFTLQGQRTRLPLYDNQGRFKQHFTIIWQPPLY